MKLYIPKDIFDNPKPPRIFLCTTGKKIIGELPSYEVSLDAKWGSYAELSFSIDRQYTDVLTGETKVHPLFDKVEGLRKVYLENLGYFIIQDPDANYSDKDSKTLLNFSNEYETASKYLESFRINTGDIDSKEVIYESSKYGNNATKDQMYKLAKYDDYDSSESYYHRVYSDSVKYTYEPIQITDEAAYKSHFGDDMHPEDILYIHGYANVQFYDPYTPELSLLHLIFTKIPEWKIGNVDATLWHKERKFDQERIAVYDFLMNDIQDAFNVAIEWDTITNTVNFYEEAEDGITEDNTVQTRWETDVFISRENLANEINISYSTDNIKTKLKVSGSDNLEIREVNLGKNYIMNLDYYHNLDWMESDLFSAYNAYLAKVKEYSPKYIEATNKWVEAYNKWDNLLNAVPAEGNIVLVGDEFKKLYCVYTTDGLDKLINNTDGKLKLYHVNEDTKANNKDNILLKLKNANSDSATIRIYNKGTEENPDYRIKTTIVYANGGTYDSKDDDEPTMSQWASGELTADKLQPVVSGGLQQYYITEIGVMGAYFVLAKDETKDAVLEEYGINLLQIKYDTYLKIFKTQTEDMFSQQDYKCIVQNDPPSGDYDENTRWLDTDSSPVKLYKYSTALENWVEISAEVSDNDQSNYENYQRYLDNYEKMAAVQAKLIEKKRNTEYYLNGHAVPGFVLKASDGSLSAVNMEIAALVHLNGYNDDGTIKNLYTVARKSMDDTLPLYVFTTSYDPNHDFAVYLNGTTPYVAYADSQGVYQAWRNKYSELTDFESSFTENQWARLSPLIREDEYINDNFLLTGYESEEERLRVSNELMEDASKELKTLSQPSLEFSMTMANILALPEFESLTNQFQLGNFVRVHIRDGYVKRSRLLEVHLNFDDLSDFSCNFGNLITTKSEIDKHADLLSQAVTAGKQVATSAGDWQTAADKANKLEEAIVGGLQNASLQIGRASGQAITWDEHGFFCRKFADGSTDTYLDEQIAIINNKIVFTNDGWKTSKAALGEFEVDTDGDGIKEKMYGLLADAVVSGYISGSTIEGGSLKIGDGSKNYFQVSPDGSVEIIQGGVQKYATSEAVDIISEGRRFSTELVYTGSTIFSEPNSECVITCEVYNWDKEITSDIINIGGTFSWIRSSTSSSDEAWNESHKNRTINTITITNEDVVKNAHFECEVNFDPDKLKKEGEA